MQMVSDSGYLWALFRAILGSNRKVGQGCLRTITAGWRGGLPPAPRSHRSFLGYRQLVRLPRWGTPVLRVGASLCSPVCRAEVHVASQSHSRNGRAEKHPATPKRAYQFISCSEGRRRGVLVRGSGGQVMHVVWPTWPFARPSSSSLDGP